MEDSNKVRLQGSTKLVVKDLSPEIKETLKHAKQNEDKIIKIQAGIRGFLARKDKSPAKKKVVSARKMEKKPSSKVKQAQKKDENENDVEAKLSQRSGGGRFKGGGMPERKQGGESYRNGLVYAKQLSDLPDYSNPATRETEKSLGPFNYDLEGMKNFDIEIVTRGPYELDNGAIYHG